MNDHTVHAGGIRRSQNGTKILRILDTVEYHDERRGSGPTYEFLDTARRHIDHFGDDPLMDTAPGIPIDRLRRDTSYSHTTLVCEIEQWLQAISRPAAASPPLGNAQLPDVSRAQGLHDGIDAVDNHDA